MKIDTLFARKREAALSAKIATDYTDFRRLFWNRRERSAMKIDTLFARKREAALSAKIATDYTDFRRLFWNRRERSAMKIDTLFANHIESLPIFTVFISNVSLMKKKFSTSNIDWQIEYTDGVIKGDCRNPTVRKAIKNGDKQKRNEQILKWSWRFFLVTTSVLSSALLKTAIPSFIGVVGCLLPKIRGWLEKLNF